MDSILTSVKKMLGIAEFDTSFDMDIIIAINSVFMILNQMGVGPSEVFSINDATTTWDAFINGDKNMQSVKTYMYQKVRLIFDPPANSAILQAMQASVNEFEWRLNVACDK